MATRKKKGTTVYPPLQVKSRIEMIADEDGANFNYYAVKFMRWGLERYERIQAKKQARESKLQPN